MQWRIILRNAFSNWVGYLVTAATGFLLSPFIVHRLGNTGYGLWTLVMSLTGYFGLLDLGIRSSVGRYVARYIELREEANVNRTVSTAFMILAAGGAVAFCAAVLVAAFFFGAFHVEPAFQQQGRVALVLTGLNMAAILPLGVFSSVLIAMERFDILSRLNIAAELMRAALVVLVLKNGYGLIGLAIVPLLSTAVLYSSIVVATSRLYRPVRLRPRFVDFAMFRDLAGFGINRFIWIIANQLIFYSDSVVIGIFLSASAITYFAIAGSLINYGRNLVSLFTDTFGPVAVRLDARQDLAGLRDLAIHGTKTALLLCLPLCLGFVFLGKQFIGLWMGSQYMSSALFLTVLTIPQLGSMSQYVPVTILAAMARHKVLAWIVLAEGLANLGLSIVLVRRIGLVGVAWGTVIPDLICTSVIVPLYVLHVLKLDWRTYVAGAYLRPLAAAIPATAVAYVFSRSVAHASWALFALEVLGICAVFFGTSFFVCLNSRERAEILEKLTHRNREALIHEF